jgi:protein-S-isoprenylcysteine O-methyltransferase Ste14
MQGSSPWKFSCLAVFIGISDRWLNTLPSKIGDTRFMSQALRFVVFLAFIAGVVLGCAGTWAWLPGWLYVAVIGLAGASVTFGVFRGNPDLVQERKNAGKLAKPWDRVLVPAMTVLPFVAVIVAALGRRFGWPAPFPAWSAWLAFVVMVLGSGLTYWGMKSNRFFSSHVRIQTERGHCVVRGGPYAYLRHPGYAGTILFTLGSPVLLNSAVAFALAVAATVLTVVRTALEDSTLRRELAGYQDYAKEVRWRLLPPVW